MGLFSFIGKAVKSVAHLVPGVGQALDVASGIGSLLHHKQPNSGSKIAILGKLPTAISRGSPSTPYRLPVLRGGGGTPLYVPRQVFSETPVMPGGGVATSSGVTPQSSAQPPTSFGGSGNRGASHKRKRRSSARASTSRKKKSSGRKLKFGSPAWRAKYMKKRRRR